MLRSLRLLVAVLLMGIAGIANSAPTFQAAGTAVTGTGTVSPAWPAHLPGDVALLFIETEGDEAVTLPTASGFVLIGQNNINDAAGTRLTVFWARATSSAMAAPTTNDPGNHVYAQILTYRGVATTGNPWDVTAGGTSGTGTTVSVASVTTTVAQTLVVQGVSRSNDNAAAAFSAQANGNLAGLAERVDAGTTSGSGGGFAVWDGVKATAGATGATTATVTNSSNAYRTIALRPVQPEIDNAILVCGTTDQVEVQFSTPVTAATAQNIANYALSNGATISGAVLDSGGQVVTLTTSTLTTGQTYTLTVNNVAGTSGGVIVAGSQASFFSEGGYLSGLPGTYYGQNNTSGAFFTGTAVTRVDPQVNYDWVNAAPGPAGIGADNFSVRWTGFVTAPITGNYTFRTSSDDGVRLYVNNVLVIDNWTDHSVANNDSAAIALTAGTRVPIIMEFYERGGQAVAQLSWSGPDGAGFQFIPRASLSHFCGIAGPRAIYTMDQTSWNGTAGEVIDSSGNGMNGTAVGGAVPVSARVCNGGQFNGSSRYVQVPGLSAILNSTASLAFWIRTTQTGNDTAWQAPGVTGVELSGTADDIFWGWLDASGRIGLSVGDTNTTKSTVAINDGTWKHIVLTRNHVTGRYDIYIDGVRNVNNGVIAAGVIGTAYSSIGRIEDTAGTPVYFNGQLDEVRVYDRVLTPEEVIAVRDITRPCAGPDHYSIAGNTTAVNCDVTVVTFTAHDSAHGLVSPAAGTIMNLSTSTNTGVWVNRFTGTGVWTPSGANNGVGTYVWPGGESSFSITLRHNAVATVGINVADGNGIGEPAGEDLSVAFVNSALRVTADGTSTATIGTQISAKNSNTGFGAQTLYLQAIRTDTNTGSCVGLIQSQTVTIEMAAARISAGPTASQVSVLNSGGTLVALGTGSGSAGAYTSVSLAFNAQSMAPLVVNYPNAGSVSLFARYQLPSPPANTFVSGTSNTFVVRPLGFRISGPPSGRTGPASTFYARAGETWPQAITVTAVAWEAADDASPVDGFPDSDAVLSNNAVTDNFGAGATATAAVSHTLAEPVSGSSGTLTATLSAFTSGQATASASWSEVGLINLFALTTSYLGSGQNVRNSSTGYTGVGRFIPYDFAVTRNTPTFMPACATGNFTYVGQRFNYSLAPVLTVTARNQAGATTQNYAGTFMRMLNTSITPATQPLRYSRFDALGSGTTPAIDVTSFPAVAGDPLIGTFASGVGTLTFSGGTTGAVFPRGTVVAPFNADIGLSFTLSDQDSVPVGRIDGVAATNPVQFGTTAAAGNGIQFVGGAKAMRFGRLRLQSANGSERLPLQMRIEAQYWNGSGFILNGSDSCTTLASANVALGNYRGNLASGETTATIAPLVLSSGASAVRFTAPGPGDNGSVDVSLNLTGATTGASCIAGMAASTGANLAWLQAAWCGTAYDDDASARATFGIYGASDRIIYLRENY